MVLSGCAIIVRGQPRGGPPPERQINLSNIRAGNLARRAAVAQPDAKDTPDEPWAFPAREFLRKKLIGKEVCFTIENKTPQGREYGMIYLGKDTNGENIAESLVAEGLATRREGMRANNPEQNRLAECEEQAKAAKKGMWSEGNGSHTIRDLKYTIENPRHFVDSHHQKPVNAIIEHVRDGSVVRALLLPDYYLVTVMLSGIKCPTFRREADGSETPEPFAAEAKFFTESRLLQRDVQIILESCHNQNILGTILHPNGNITELLLKEGFARCVDWSIAVYTRGAEKLRAAERFAKERRLRIWRDYVAPTANLDQKDKQFVAKVMQVLNADAIVVKLNSGDYKTIHLSSIRPPRLEGENTQLRNAKIRFSQCCAEPCCGGCSLRSGHTAWQIEWRLDFSSHFPSVPLASGRKRGRGQLFRKLELPHRQADGARILEWVAVSSSRGSFQPQDQAFTAACWGFGFPGLTSLGLPCRQPCFMGCSRFIGLHLTTSCSEPGFDGCHAVFCMGWVAASSLAAYFFLISYKAQRSHLSPLLLLSGVLESSNASWCPFFCLLLCFDLEVFPQVSKCFPLDFFQLPLPVPAGVPPISPTTAGAQRGSLIYIIYIFVGHFKRLPSSSLIPSSIAVLTLPSLQLGPRYYFAGLCLLASCEPDVSLLSLEHLLRISVKGDTRVPPEEICLPRRMELPGEQCKFLPATRSSGKGPFRAEATLGRVLL
ncbi:hypothetical protein FD755_012417 [Muntiacus reevesi]|uniref:TNase-like domain-containing protein n=1 Tax=Muntiacus reevesi TaxID=9886 RepID=A0A5N3XNU4_MUNRE|nr:hypothetical protein FD755_012417 [Muntiacus reevesi]